MNTFINTSNQLLQFTVNKKQVSKKNVLKTSILYDKVEHSANLSVNPFKENLIEDGFKSFELTILNDAYLNDKLYIKNNIKKYNDSELELKVTVYKKSERNQDIICKATFGYSLEKAS
ncbi:hypothetical protein [Tenacibaculum sp. IB213877]|uniref:hypothetical protein n=1 Tax=Tenacibaculum sp. IB213877 TaxID=3097351 RepID=UPI002A5A569C|nr:hypothetical protein [Tenacibaculum sp. IB213877]MDY0781648.1 hypothetical protein [Tenacibaculum sp. IB213877]